MFGWLKRGKRKQRSSLRNAKGARRLACEPLESRNLLSVVDVTGSLSVLGLPGSTGGGMPVRGAEVLLVDAARNVLLDTNGKPLQENTDNSGNFKFQNANVGNAGTVWVEYLPRTSTSSARRRTTACRAISSARTSA